MDSRDLRLGYAATRLKLESLAKENNVGVDQLRDAVLTQSYLQLETALDMTATNFNFPILQGVNNPGQQQSPTELRLLQQDAFFVTHIGYFLNFPKDAAGADSTLRDQYFRFPSVALGLSNLDNLMVLWNSKLIFSVDNQLIIPAWHTEKHKNIPQTQYQAFTGAGPTPGQFFNQFDEVAADVDGYYPVQPMISLWGNANNVITLQLPHAIGAGTWTNQAPKMVIRFYGILAQNITNVNIKRK